MMKKNFGASLLCTFILFMAMFATSLPAYAVRGGYNLYDYKNGNWVRSGRSHSSLKYVKGSVKRRFFNGRWHNYKRVIDTSTGKVFYTHGRAITRRDSRKGYSSLKLAKKSIKSYFKENVSDLVVKKNYNARNNPYGKIKGNTSVGGYKPTGRVRKGPKGKKWYEVKDRRGRSLMVHEKALRKNPSRKRAATPPIPEKRPDISPPIVKVSEKKDEEVDSVLPSSTEKGEGEKKKVQSAKKAKLLAKKQASVVPLPIKKPEPMAPPLPIRKREQPVLSKKSNKTMVRVCSSNALGFSNGEATDSSSNCVDQKVRAKAKKGDFITRLVKISPKRAVKRNGRRLYEWPMGGSNSNIGFCGSQHIGRNSRRQRPHMTAVASCMMAGIAQEWRKTKCPKNSGHCQLTFGDTSYASGKKRWIKRGKKRVSRAFVKPPGGSKHSAYWPHASHHNGECIDIRPMRKKGYSNRPTKVAAKNYDSKINQEFAKLLVKWGAETTKHRKKAQFFFNDPKIYGSKNIGARKLVNHYDHFHVCFRNNKSNGKRCRKLTVDTNLCPTLKIPGE